MGLSVREASDPYGNFMLQPAPAGPGVCVVCHTFIEASYERCYACAHQPQQLDAVVPISYSIHLEQLHDALRGYKDAPVERVRRRFSRGLAAVLWRYLTRHEGCVASAAGLNAFDLVTTVPSGTPSRDENRPALRRLVGELCAPTVSRYRRVLRPTGRGRTDRAYDAERYEATEWLDERSVLLIDDTWTTGRSAQAAAAALRAAGADRVALVVVGRHVRRDFGDNDSRLRAMARPYDWSTCAVHPEVP